MSLLGEKIMALQKILNDLKESGANETKSTAGDKHETALAMLQIEQANTRVQLKDALDQKAMYERINPLLSSTTILNGSLVKTNRGYLFLSVAAGKAIIDGHNVIALSSQSPLGGKLIGLAVDDTVEVNNAIYAIEAVF